MTKQEMIDLIVEKLTLEARKQGYVGLEYTSRIRARLNLFTKKELENHINSIELLSKVK